MSTTMNLPCVRFVKRVNNGALGSKYSYIAMMAENAKALESAPWHESSVPLQNVTMPVNKVTETDAVYDASGAMTSPPSFSAFMSDGFDCFQQGGDARKEDGTMCGYAGCVAYRFKIPSSALSVPLSCVSLQIQRDRYCRAGVRVVLVLSNDTSPSSNWTVVRGETGSGDIVSPSTASTSLGVASWGFLGQSNVPNLVSGRAAAGTITFNASGIGGFSGLSATNKAYLWVYLTLEDYQSYWTMYNAKESRYYSIEGSAVLVASKAAFTFNGTVSADGATTDTATTEIFSALTNIANRSVTSDDDITSCGNFLNAGFRSLLPITTRRSRNYIDLDIGRYPTKFALHPPEPAQPIGTYSPISSQYNYVAGGLVPIEDCDIIGGCGGFKHQESPPVVRCGVSYDFNSLQDSIADGLLRASVMAEFCYTAWRVPQPNSGTYAPLPPSFAYKRIRLYSPDELQSLFTPGAGLDVQLLLWRSSSPAFDSPWGEVAVSALASNTAFFTGGQKKISGSVIGNGSKTQGITVSAEAELLAELDLFGPIRGNESNYENIEEFSAELPMPVHPNDVIILVPHLRKSHVNMQSGSGSVSWSLYKYFAIDFMTN